MRKYTFTQFFSLCIFLLTVGRLFARTTDTLLPLTLYRILVAAHVIVIVRREEFVMHYLQQFHKRERERERERESWLTDLSTITISWLNDTMY